MMLEEKIQEDLKIALKEKKELNLSVLRMLNAVMINKEKEKRYKITRQIYSSENLAGQGKEKIEILEKDLQEKSQLSDNEIIEIIFSEIKKKKDALLLFEKGERWDLVEKEKKELEVLEKYLPEQLSEEELRKLIKEAIEKTGVKELKETGKVMAELMPKVKGKVEGSKISQIIKELLSF